jgi:hypothetical protein
MNARDETIDSAPAEPLLTYADARSCPRSDEDVRSAWPASLTSSAEIFTVAGLLLLGVAIRLIKISQPYVDSWSFKQGTIAMIAENFCRNGFNSFYPQINWSGKFSPLHRHGIVAAALPCILAYARFGVREWVCRAMSVLFFSLSLPFFYLLVKRSLIDAAPHLGAPHRSPRHRRDPLHLFNEQD